MDIASHRVIHTPTLWVKCTKIDFMKKLVTLLQCFKVHCIAPLFPLTLSFYRGPMGGAVGPRAGSHILVLVSSHSGNLSVTESV